MCFRMWSVTFTLEFAFLNVLPGFQLGTEANVKT